MKKLFLICITLFFSSLTMNVSAKGGGFFGARDSIHKIQDLDMPSPNGESLYLGYRTKSYFLVLGVYMKDEGYVIGINGNDKSYYDLPDETKLKSMQELGLFPKELPKYSVPIIDYLFGFSLWILLALYGIYVFIKNALTSE